MYRFTLLAGAIALGSPAAALPRVYIFCMADDRSAPFIRVGPMSPNQTEARFLYPPEHEGARRDHDMLWIGMTETGEIRYQADDLSLLLAAENTALQVGDAIMSCSMMELPQDHPRGDYPALAQSAGATVRAAPAADQPVLEQIATGEMLYLVSRRADETADFSWFELYGPDGSAGFVWGREICPGFEPLDGALPSCDP